MDKVVKIMNLKDQSSDYEFWKTKSELERLEAVEFLRKQYLSFLKNADTRLQRVCRITHKTQD
jgi:hypothetical protein